jgi:predicted O-methyltransferase YrrM
LDERAELLEHGAVETNGTSRIAPTSAVNGREAADTFDSVKRFSHSSVARRWIRGIWDRNVRLPATRAFEWIVLRKQAERFYMYLGGHIFFETLYAARKFDLFTLLAKQGPLSRKQIAERLGIDEQPARIMLLGLTVGGLIKLRRGKYRNSMIAGQLLSRNSRRQVLSYVDFEHDIIYKPMHHLYEAIKEYRNVGLEEFPGNEPTLYERLARQPALEHIFQQAMQDLSVQSNQDLARFFDFSTVQHVVDVGGGDGTNAIALASQWPHLTVTVFDSPSVCEIAQRNIKNKGFAERILTLSGDCFHDKFPTNADCFLFGHFFTIWSKEKDIELLQKSYEALPDGGRVILYNMMQDDSEDGPWSAAMGSPYFLALASGEGMLYTWKEYEDWMRTVGFSKVKRFKLPRHQGVVTCQKVGLRQMGQ